jgi:putative tryptophan/tyrosine transport system substrate-binding protein
MRRREFILALGGAAAWPLTARAQQPAMPVVGFLNTQGAGTRTHLVEAVKQGLAETGYVAGRNVVIEYRWAENHLDQLPALAADLVQRQVSVIVATGGARAILAAKAATSTIPIVFTSGSDPVRAGLVPSLNRPGGNVTGASFLTDALGAKRLGLLREVMPKAATVAVLMNPKGPDAEGQMKDVPLAAQSIGQPIKILNATNQEEIDSVFATFSQLNVGALLVGADPFFNDRRDQIIAHVARLSIPAIYELREFAEAGGLMSYGASLADAYRRAGVYAGRVLKGAKPADLPVEQSVKFELVVNLKTAKALGLALPPTLLTSADEVIE